MVTDFHKREEKAEVAGTFSYNFTNPPGKECGEGSSGEGVSDERLENQPAPCG